MSAPTLHGDLGSLFAPRSVAVIGASDDPGKWGNRLALGALRGATRRPVFLVNRRGGTVLGQRAYPSLAELPEPPELVAICVPAQAFERSVEDALAAGARALVAISSGLGETGAAGRERERVIVERVRAAGAVLLGPNCLGVFDASADLELGWDPYPRGRVGLIAQSGNLTLDLGLGLAGLGLGFSRVATLGNQADLDVAALAGAFAGHDETRVLALYVEDFREGRAVTVALGRAVDAGKRVLVLAAGASEAGRRAARSHTGALASDRRAIEAACSVAGATCVSTPRELLELAQASLVRCLPRGRRVAIVGDGGGHGVIAADTATRAGLEVPALEHGLAGRIAEALPGTASVANPIDLGGASDDWLGAFERTIAIVAGAAEIDAVVLTGYFGGYGEMSAEYAEPELDAARNLSAISARTGTPLVVHTMYDRSAAAGALRVGGVPVYRDIEAATAAVRYLARVAAGRRLAMPALPPPSAEPVTAGGYAEARELVAAAGIPVVAARVVRTTAEARAAADELGYPVVLKALGASHKSDAGGVVLGLESGAALCAAADDLRQRLAPATLSVERMAPLADGVELIAGSRRDERFGPLVLAGIGGLDAELVADVAVALAPVDPETAEELLRSLRAAPRLLGSRGRPPLAIARAADAVARLSALAAARPEIAELEINPLLVTVDGVLALDARLVLAEPSAREPAG